MMITGIYNFGKFSDNNMYFKGRKIEKTCNSSGLHNDKSDLSDSVIDDSCKSRTKAIHKKIAPYVLAGLMLSGGLSICTDNRVSGVQDLGDNVRVEYVNVKPEIRDSVLIPLKSLCSKLNSENNFLKGVDINFVKSYDDLSDNHSFKTFLKENNMYNTKGISFYSDGKLKRVIVLEEDSHGMSDKIFNYAMTGRFSTIPTLRHSLMHEVGHQFDEYFGHDHNAKYAKDFDSFIYEKEVNKNTNPYSYDLENQDEEDIFIDYTWNASLSDKPEFQKAIKKDLEYIASLKKDNSKHIPLNLDYYASGIDFTKSITEDDVDLADRARTEIYANLFAYAVGENDGDKVDFVNAFKNSYNVVKSDIAQKLGPNVVKY